MTRYIIEYISEPNVNGETSREITFTNAVDVAAATEKILDACGAFINILSVVPCTASTDAPGLIQTVQAELETQVKVKKDVKFTPKEKPVKIIKAEKPTGDKKVTASSVVRSRIVLAKEAGRSLEQACDEITLWCMSNLSMSKSTARGYVTSQWIRVV